MTDQELHNLWNSQNQKLHESLQLNRAIIKDLSFQKIHRGIGRLRRPKLFALFIGIPYLMILCLITFIAYQASAIFVFIGFGLIALLMLALICGYIYHLYLIDQIQGTDDVLTVQKKIASFKLSNYNLTRLVLLQIPLWTLCWMSIDALQSSPWVYGGINLLIFLALCYITYWLFNKTDIKNRKSKVYRFFFSGNEWELLKKSSSILDQLGEFD